MTFTVKCPVCHKRVFDVIDSMEGSIEIKCPKCKTVAEYTHRKTGDDQFQPVAMKRKVVKDV